jgi:hypothetical protein
MARRCFEGRPIDKRQNLRQAEIKHLCDGRPRNHDVGRFEIPMHDASRVRVRDRFSNVEAIANDVGEGSPPSGIN